MTSSEIVRRAALGAASTIAPLMLACTPSPAPTTPPSDASAGETARLGAKVEALEERVRVLEQREPAPAPTVKTGWSCSAKCGTRDRSTTEFKVSYSRVTGHGESAASAYQALIDACEGTLYERIEDEAFLGAEMRNVCLADGGSN